MQERIEKIQGFLQKGEAAIITSPQNRFYFLDFNSSAGTLLITKNSAYFLIDFRYYEKAKQTVQSADVILCERLYLQLSEILKSEGIERLLIETEYVTLSQSQSLAKNLPDFEIAFENKLSEEIGNLRKIKSKREIEYIKSAQKITDNAFVYILDRINIGVSERKIALDLEFFMRKEGSNGIAFDTIVVSGKNSSLPHGAPTDKKIENGDFVTMDFGARVMGYCSDMTRTVAVGEISEKQNFVYNTVLNAQLKALAAVKAGAKCQEIDKIARDIINNAGFEGCFGHGLGHSLGLEIHESPACNTRDTSLLREGMLMTVEPGIYIENEFGVRIEDMVVVTPDSHINLTKSPKELVVL